MKERLYMQSKECSISQESNTRSLDHTGKTNPGGEGMKGPKPHPQDPNSLITVSGPDSRHVCLEPFNLPGQHCLRTGRG